MSYVEKDYEFLFYNLLEHAQENQLISHNDLFQNYVKSKQDISNYYVMTLSILADSEEDIYYDMSEVYRSDKVETALGSDLDDIGDKIGCPRPDATRAGVELLFTLGQEYDSNLTLPKDLIVSNNLGISYYTVDEAIIPAGVREVYVYALALEKGIGSRVGANTLTKLETTILVDDDEMIGISVTNPNSSSGGHEVYNDEDYRKLLLDWVKSNTRGSKEAYAKYFANVDGLDGYKLIPNWDTSGTLKIVLEPGYAEQLQKCYEEITQDVCQFPDDITMFSPNKVPINIYASCNVDIDEVNPYSQSEKDEIKSRIEDGIKLYIDGDIKHDGLKIGEDFIPYKLGVFLSNLIPELKNISFDNPSPVTITDEELGIVNEIIIEME